MNNKRSFITVVLSNDKEITQLNKKYFKRDYTTDVLSFNLNESTPEGDFHLGDIIVNKDQAARQSKEYGNDLEHEIAELVEHGMLHLLGVHHADDDEKSVHGVHRE